jgi:hypothetical protein
MAALHVLAAARTHVPHDGPPLGQTGRQTLGALPPARIRLALPSSSAFGLAVHGALLGRARACATV